MRLASLAAVRAVIGASIPHIGDIVGGILCLAITFTSDVVN